MDLEIFLKTEWRLVIFHYTHSQTMYAVDINVGDFISIYFSN
jgi:hypothetical protein